MRTFTFGTVTVTLEPCGFCKGTGREAGDPSLYRYHAGDLYPDGCNGYCASCGGVGVDDKSYGYVYRQVLNNFDRLVIDAALEEMRADAKRAIPGWEE